MPRLLGPSSEPRRSTEDVAPSREIAGVRLFWPDGLGGLPASFSIGPPGLVQEQGQPSGGYRAGAGFSGRLGEPPTITPKRARRSWVWPLAR